MNRLEIDKIYIIGEIGQNHNGDVKIAKELIDYASMAGCSAVKIAKRDMSSELTDEAYDRLYNNRNAFAKTYGKHREYLELSLEDHKFLKKYTNNRNMDYLLSVCDIPSLEVAIALDCPLIKIPSKEINNIPLLERAAICNKRVAFSIGLCTRKEFTNALDILPFNSIVVVCTSMYPTYLDNVNLRRINLLKYFDHSIGYSSHTPDPVLGIAAVAMGATYIEFHITLDQEMKGSDHVCSLELEDLAYMVESIKNVEIALGSEEIPETLPKYLNSTKKKLWKEECEDGIYRIH